MCGRSSLTKTEKEIEERFGATFYSDDLERYNPLPNFNVAPTHMCPIITSDDTDKIHLFRWGLIPFWAKDVKIGYKMINARMETITVKNTFAAAFRSRRCLVPMDGFYEWKKVGKEKIPYRIRTKHQEIFTSAGLWESWRSKEDEVIHSFTIITLPANDFMSSIHDRMPAIFSKEEERQWLDPKLTKEQALNLLIQYPSDDMYAYQVGDKVGNVRHNDPSLIEPLVNGSIPLSLHNIKI